MKKVKGLEKEKTKKTCQALDSDENIAESRNKLNDEEKKFVEYWENVLKTYQGKILPYPSPQDTNGRYGSYIVTGRVFYKEMEFPEIQYSVCISWPEKNIILLAKWKNAESFLRIIKKRWYEKSVEINEENNSHLFYVLYHLFQERIRTLMRHHNNRIEEEKRGERALSKTKLKKEISNFIAQLTEERK